MLLRGAAARCSAGLQPLCIACPGLVQCGAGIPASYGEVWGTAQRPASTSLGNQEREEVAVLAKAPGEMQNRSCAW